MGQRRGRGVVLTDEGWKKLENALNEWQNQNNFDKPYTIEDLIEVTLLDPGTISKVLSREVAVDKRTLERFFHGFNLDLVKSDYTKLFITTNNKLNKYFCSEAPDVSIFYGRTDELNTLEKWIINDCCRLILLVGIGGIGKTSLSAKIIQNISDNFNFTIWLSLRNAPPPLEIITNLLQVLSNGEEIDLAKNITLLIKKLLGYLQNQRCLIVDEKTIACGNIGNEDNLIGIWQIDSLNKSNQAPNIILKGHDDNIWSIAFNSDGTKIVSGSSDRTVKIWDSHTGQCLKTLYGHNRPVLSVSFSPDGKTVASCGGHSIIKLWNIETGECLKTIQERASYIIKFNSNGLILASGHTSGIVKFWDTKNGKCIQTLGNHGKPIISIAFSRDGKFIAYGSYDGTVTVWDINDNKSIAILQHKFSSPWSLAFSKFSQSSNLLAVGRDREIIQLWDIKTSQIVGFLQGDRPLERVNLRGVKGLTTSTIVSLKELGAYI